MNSYVVLLITVYAAFLLLELLSGRLRLRGISRRDNLLDFASLLQTWFVIGPLITFGSAALAAHWLPAYANHFAATPWWLQLLLFLLLEDMVQYWYHRSAHRVSWLWPLHQLHHSAPYMGIRMVYRNGFFYGLLMPNIWISSLLVYLGFGEVYVGYYLLKLVVSLGAHSEIRWDAWMYRQPLLRPLAWILQRTISTPSTHFAHHALVNDDGIGNNSGNFGNLLFFWDVLFGSAHITQHYPARFGNDAAPGTPLPRWQTLLFYPLFKEPAAREAGAVREHPDDGARTPLRQP